MTNDFPDWGHPAANSPQLPVPTGEGSNQVLIPQGLNSGGMDFTPKAATNVVMVLVTIPSSYGAATMTITGLDTGTVYGEASGDGDGLETVLQAFVLGSQEQLDVVATVANAPSGPLQAGTVFEATGAVLVVPANSPYQPLSIQGYAGAQGIPIPISLPSGNLPVDIKALTAPNPFPVQGVSGGTPLPIEGVSGGTAVPVSGNFLPPAPGYSVGLLVNITVTGVKTVLAAVSGKRISIQYVSLQNSGPDSTIAYLQGTIGGSSENIAAYSGAQEIGLPFNGLELDTGTALNLDVTYAAAGGDLIVNIMYDLD